MCRFVRIGHIWEQLFHIFFLFFILLMAMSVLSIRLCVYVCAMAWVRRNECHVPSWTIFHWLCIDVQCVVRHKNRINKWKKWSTNEEGRGEGGKVKRRRWRRAEAEWMNGWICYNGAQRQYIDDGNQRIFKFIRIRFRSPHLMSLWVFRARANYIASTGLGGHRHNTSHYITYTILYSGNSYQPKFNTLNQSYHTRILYIATMTVSNRTTQRRSKWFGRGQNYIHYIRGISNIFHDLMTIWCLSLATIVWRDERPYCPRTSAPAKINKRLKYIMCLNDKYNINAHSIEWVSESEWEGNRAKMAQRESYRYPVNVRDGEQNRIKSRRNQHAHDIDLILSLSV